MRWNDIAVNDIWPRIYGQCFYVCLLFKYIDVNLTHGTFGDTNSMTRDNCQLLITMLSKIKIIKNMKQKDYLVISFDAYEIRNGMRHDK